MSDKQLPTAETVTGIRPESIPTPEGKTEKRELRSINSKTFLHSEKPPDGKEIRTCQVQLGAVCYRNDNNELRSIDTTVRDLGDGVIGVDWAPYRFRLHSTGVGFDFTSREGGQVSIKLTGIGGEKFDDQAALKPDITDNVITFKDVRPGCDIVFRCLNDRVKTLRILHDDNAPRTFEWSVASDKLELVDESLTGTDAAGNQLELFWATDGELFIETWGGLTRNGAEVAYPVNIDPTVTVNPSVDADDGYELNANFNTASVYVGSSSGAQMSGGIRFTGVAVNQGVVPTLSTLGLNSILVNGSGGSGTIYGRASDNAGQFGNGSELPSIVSATTASTVMAAVGTTGLKTWDVTGITTEIFARGGWANGNNMAFPILGDPSASNFTRFTDKNAGGNIPYLSITYTAGGGTVIPVIMNQYRQRWN